MIPMEVQKAGAGRAAIDPSRNTETRASVRICYGKNVSSDTKNGSSTFHVDSRIFPAGLAIR